MPYRFGDITKSLLSSVGSAVTGKPKEEYRFGDISRAAVGGVKQGLDTVFRLSSGSPADPAAEHAPAVAAVGLAAKEEGGGGGGGGGGGAGGAAGETKAEEPMVEGPATIVTADRPLSMEEVWGSFFRSSFAVCTEAVRQGWLTLDAIEDRDAFLYVGIPAITILEALLRSVDRAGVVLAKGIEVTAKSTPVEIAELFESLLSAKPRVASLRSLSAPQMAILRRLVLTTEMPKEGEALDPVAREAITSASAAVASIASRVSQLSFYKSNFEDILTALERSDALRAEAKPGHPDVV